MNNFSEIEKKWQDYQEKNETFKALNKSEKEKYFYLVEFPYPSGDGLHVGHTRSYTALDIMARKKRMQGYNVLFPMGWDAFGEAAEGYAIKNKIHPKQAVDKNISTFKSQCKKMGFSFDWDREISTTDPKYMKWTQWQFLKFFEKGLAYKAPAKVNWCPKCKITKSNEEAAGGVCDRCNSQVEEKQKEQWMLKMRSYAESLIDGLKDTHFEEKIKNAQINWIGKTTGAEVYFGVKQIKYEKISIFTTRPDTIFGVSSVQVSIDHPLIKNHEDKIENINEIKEYIKSIEEKAKMELLQKMEKSKDANKQERKQMRKDSFKQEKEKTGVLIKGLTAVNPVNNKEIPIFISNYVLSDKGFGAVMSVPAHDQRDFDFAKKYGTEILPVVEGGNTEKCAYTGDGKHINSGFLNGLNNEESFKKIVEFLIKSGIGKEKTDYKLDDWVFSRQRFWGEPIPLIKCGHCGWVPVLEKDLPVELPDVAKYEPTDTGESPLSEISDWVNTTCPICGLPAKRETDTMPGWAGSSWYWIRFMDPDNDNEFASQEAMKYWEKVDFYNGGMEHAARHLLYARFWNHFLYDQGLVPNKEPFEIRVAHGMVMGEGGVKMSKSLGNVVNPNHIIEKYGADALRTYIMFMGDYSESVNWQEDGVKSCRKFLERVMRLGEKLSNIATPTKLENLVHKTIKKVTEDIDCMKFNTAISAMHELTNELERQKNISKDSYRTLLLLLSPFAPHITEEMNEKFGLGTVLANSKWPSYDAQKLEETTINMAVQVNGKLKGVIEIKKGVNEDTAKEKALTLESVVRFLEGKQIVKVIVVPNKIVNIVAK